MEEYDDLLPTPDRDGALELSYRGWDEVDDIIWTMGEELVKLSLCYNRLSQIAPEIGDLKLLQHLDLSCNSLEQLPARIGVLRNLRVLRVNGNKLEQLPEEIGGCRMMEELVASENQLTRLPRSLGNLKKLTTLLVQNNALQIMPPTLADIGPSLVKIDCRNNPNLDMLPKLIRGDTELIVWVCKLHRENEFDTEHIIDSIDLLHRLSDLAYDRHDHLSDQLRRMNDDHMELTRNMPTGFDRAGVIYSAYSRAAANYASKQASKVCVVS